MKENSPMSNLQIADLETRSPRYHFMFVQLYSGIAVFLFFFYLSSGILVYRERNSEFFRRRIHVLVQLSIFLGLASTLTSTANLSTFQSVLDYTCWERVFLVTFFYPAWMFTYLLRSTYLVCLNYIQTIQIQDAREKPGLTWMEMFCFMFHKDHIAMEENRWLKTTSMRNDSNPASHFTGNSDPTKKVKPPFGMSNMTYSIIKSMLIFYVIVIIDIGIIYLLYPDIFNPTYRCLPEHLWGANVLRLILSCVCILVLIEARKLNDGLHIQRELLMAMITFTLGLVMYLINLYYPQMTSLGSSIWLAISCFLCHILTVVIPLSKALYTRYLQASFKLDLESFRQALTDGVTFAELRQIMVRDFCVENALFLEEYWKVKSMTPKKQELALKHLFETFLKPNAKYQLNIPSTVLKKIREKMNAEATIDLFEEVVREVEKMIYYNSFRRYLEKNKS